MKKGALAAIGIVVALGACYAGATAWSGKKIEERHAQWQERLQAQAPFMKRTVQNYSRGFLGASSQTVYEIGCGTAPGKAPLQIVVSETVQHGPFAGGTVAAAVIDSSVTLGGDEGAKVAAMFAGAPITARTVVGFTGRFTTTLKSAEAKMPLPDGAELAWRGFTGTIEAGSDATGPFSYRVASPGLAVTDAAHGASLRLTGLGVEGEGHYVDGFSRLAVGKGRGHADALEAAVTLPATGGAVARPVNVSFTGLAFESETAIADQLMTMTSSLVGAGNIDGAKIDRFDMRGSMKRLHAPSYQRLMDRLGSESPNCDTPDERKDPALLFESMQADLMTLMKANPEFSLDKLSVDHAGQRGELAYALGVAGVTDTDAQLPPLALLMARAHATASARVPVAWLRRLSQESAARMPGAAPGPAVLDVMLEKAAADGYLVRDGEHVKSSVDFSGGVLKVNGKVISPGAGRR